MKIDISATLHKSAFEIRKHSPEILTGLGIAGVVTGAVMACVATTKINSVLDKHKAEVNRIHKEHYIPENIPGSDEKRLTKKKEEQRALTGAYLRTGLDFVQLYGPSVAVGTFSIAGILTGTHILRRRNVALAAAYVTIDRSFKEYRGRVAERFGEDVERELRYDIHTEKVEETVVDEDGKKHKVKKNIEVIGDGLPSDYARYFAYGESLAAEPNADYNAYFLKCQQEIANTILKAKGYLFLNDVYDMLGIERSIPGQMVGWVYDRHCEDHGDNYVDFGIREVCRKKSDSPGEYEKVFLLDFNVDGSILDHSFNKGLITT